MEKIQSIAIKDLYPFPDNPFKVVEGEELNLLAESIRDYGIITPLVVRPREGGGYEVIAGHRRIKACEKAGIETVPAFVRDMDRDSAIIVVVDSNLQREHILPSEKAFAYKMKLEAIKHQGRTSTQVAEKLSVDSIGNADGISGDTVWRYVRLTNLSPELLQLVDDGKIALSPAVALSYLSEKEQADLLETIESEDCTPSYAQAIQLKKLSQDGSLDMDTIFKMLTEPKPNQQEQYKFKKEDIRKFFPKSYTDKQIIEKLFQLLEQYRKRQQNRDSR